MTGCACGGIKSHLDIYLYFSIRPSIYKFIYQTIFLYHYVCVYVHVSVCLCVSMCVCMCENPQWTNGTVHRLQFIWRFCLQKSGEISIFPFESSSKWWYCLPKSILHILSIFKAALNLVLKKVFHSSIHAANAIGNANE